MPPTTRSSRSRGAAEQLAEQPAPKRSKRGLAAAPAKAVEKQKVQTYISVSESPEPEGEGSSTAGPSTRAETSVEQSPPAAAATTHEHEQSQGSVGGMKGSPLSKGDAEGSQPRSQHSAAPSKSSQPSAGANKASQPGTGDAGQPHSQRSASQAKQAKQSQQSVADEDNDNGFDFGSDCSSVKSADFDIEDPMQSFGLSSREREAIEIGIQATAARLADEGTASGGGGTLLLKEGAVLEVQLPLHPLSPLQRTTLDLAEDAHLVLISLDVQGGWTSSAVPPTSIVRLVSTTSSTIISHSDEHTSATPLGLLLYAGVRAIAKKMWGEPEYLYELSTSTLRLLCNAGDYCFCCAERLNFGGVKPTVCDSPLCQYQLDDLGLGASLSELRDERIADFLIATAHAAAVGAVSRPSTLPALPSSRDGSPLTAKSLRTTIEALPPVEVMAALSPTELKAQIGAEAFATLRWIFTSNRAHLVALAQHERIQINGDDIGGELHLKVSTSTRSHEAAFQAQKAKYGSFMAWHGSGTQNWHAIIRTSLKNASGTAMMSTGAAYGAGIYVADGSSLSLGYARTIAESWENAALGGPLQILAVVEIANSPELIRPPRAGMIVAPQEHFANLAYIVVGTKNKPVKHNISAEALKIKQYMNDTTIASMEPIDKVEKELLFVDSVGYAWDITELVQIIKASHGLFINAYNKTPFSPVDVQRILEHPSGYGQELRTLDVENRAMQKHVSQPTLAKVRAAGNVAKFDQSAGFDSAMLALNNLKTYLDTLQGNEKLALERAPFSAVDSVTRQTRRSTIMHMLTQVISGGECVHAAGDWLLHISAD